jgi:hypothetical protein
LEDQEFRKWIQTHTPDWECVWDRPNPRSSDGPRDRWYVYRAPLLSAEVWSIVWIWSTLLSLHQEARRRRDIAATIEELNELRQRLAGAKTRLRGAAEIDLQIKTLLDKHHVNRYLKVSRTVREDHVYKQTRRGRPGPDMAYRRITKRRFDIEWTMDEEASPTITIATACIRHAARGMTDIMPRARSCRIGASMMAMRLGCASVASSVRGMIMVSSLLPGNRARKGESTCHVMLWGTTATWAARYSSGASSPL